MEKAAMPARSAAMAADRRQSPRAGRLAVRNGVDRPTAPRPGSPARTSRPSGSVRAADPDRARSARRSGPAPAEEGPAVVPEGTAVAPRPTQGAAVDSGAALPAAP